MSDKIVVDSREWYICAGMVRAASTVQYLMTVGILGRMGQVHDVGWTIWQNFSGVYREYNWKDCPKVVRAHAYLPEHCDVAKDLIINRGCPVIYTYRDLGDVMASLCALEYHKDLRDNRDKFRQQAAEIKRVHDLWMSTENLFVWAYEDFVSDLLGQACRLCDFLGAEFWWDEIVEIADYYNIDKMRKRVESGMYDTYPKVYEHSAPIQSGRIGRRDELEQWQSEIVREVLDES